MLEDLALQYSEVPEDGIRLISYGLVIFGGIIGGITYRSVAEIRRAHYFALSGLIILCMAVVTFGGMAFIVQALAGGFFWVIVAAEMLARIAGGFFFARIAVDRSRDAYGHGGNAVLAFIPFANLWLLFTPSKNAISAHREPTIPLMTGGLGILSGFVLALTGFGLSIYAEEDGRRRVEEAAAAGVFDVAMLDRNLAAMAAEVQTPFNVDETTTMISMKSEGHELRMVYIVDPPLEFLPASVRLGTTQKNCSLEGLSSLIDAGALIRHVYTRKDGSEIGVVEVTKQACGR